ncbi:alpha/beta hydrolase [Listeria cossartiae subsp. cayugensis]|uniref:Alpha/beta hydrolase n=1 Tax=Listeria cossartiae subsp. cayugensis TaxID=2713505 RepID=A0ABU2IMZ3_9LIST|nr:alpha/beta hydrolase [Listeria cossartiae]MBC1806072.1 alpha/beta hydrolase [Listeria cossartiae subsp. cayugensis]MDT0002577.1 alpha/beta hydrolase [Listeria cossartiae subsp. cayugensis]MDT0019055.1 alpha/beta hydrolase [Listeria cossartiae subsp. cayugensis]MDT0035372.1 alpha/beta hydrolase [Listeria cossartiae subsp. cayugensis]MDT0040805.1 alpha/beta hydrolase [Listeria cossartiae subsp. cayugensis]
MKKVIIAIIILAIIVAGFWIIFLQFEPTKKAAKEPTITSNKTTKKTVNPVSEIAIPTLFVHGYSGTANSFGGMINRLADEGDVTKSLVMTVAADGTVSTEGNYDKFSNNPTIQVIFEDNKSSMDNQAQWIQNVMKELKNNYHIEKVYAVGHSMGGVSLTSYIEKVGSDNAYPILEKLVLIGSPLNGLVIGDDGVTAYDLTDKGPKQSSDRYSEFMKNKQKIPTHLRVLNIAGDTLDGTKSDGSVSVASALSGKFIFEGQAESYQEKTFTGKNAAHSKLHENTDVDAEVADFLWGKEKVD